jgi:hypothetical protein
MFRTHRYICFGVSVAMLSMPGVLSAQGTPVSPDVRALSGCYVVTLGAWSGPLPPTGDALAHTPPMQFRLDTLTTSRRIGFVVQPTTLVASDRPLTAWRPIAPDSVRIVWSTGFVGVALHLRVIRDSLIGLATTFHDYHPAGELPDPTARVVAVRSRCPT